MSELWEGLGFEIHQLADFNSSARRQGVVHAVANDLVSEPPAEHSVAP
jgi:hypothetical protein